MRVLGVIPARLGSTRLPNKPLQLLAGEPLITRVIERVLEHGLIDQLVVATDSPRVVQVVEGSGVRAVLTDGGHQTGTDRVAEVANRSDFAAFDTIVNIQGDEPFMTREALAGSLGRLEQGDEIGTAAAPLDLALAGDPSRVKVVTDARGRALYFSRAVIPHRREPDDPSDGLYWQHLGIYAFTRAALTRWVSLPACAPEQAERLEQLRALHNGMTIGVARLQQPALPGVDTAEDLRRAEAHWHTFQGQV
ncbi:MAG: 3-deoxy-manno-octulosonate cytidylyltransferase synthetase [Gemmatimonadales bacterium]|nr:3-deoxy-manno-octulosonate cytidylyltransferase synthetase [Gemmatimonadales bacterium]